MYRDILLAYDGSRDSREALQQGAELARACNARVLLLAVVRPSEGILPIEAHDFDRITDDLLEGLAVLRGRGLASDARLSVGHPVERITAVAREIGAELVIVGHRSQNTFARWWNGSVGASVVSRAPCSILVAVKTPVKLANARSHANRNTPGIARDQLPVLKLVSDHSIADTPVGPSEVTDLNRNQNCKKPG
jgi:nucleotide-binding universal stress UspA family protein